MAFRLSQGERKTKLFTPEDSVPLPVGRPPSREPSREAHKSVTTMQRHLRQTGHKITWRGRGRTKKNKRWCVRGTRGKQRRDRWAPQRPPKEALDDEDTGDDGDGDIVRRGGNADRRIDAGRRVVLSWSSARHKVSLQNRGEKRQPTARSTSPPSAMKWEAINGPHGVTFRHTSLKRWRLRFESKAKLSRTNAHGDLISPHGCVPRISARCRQTVGLRVTKLVLVSSRTLLGQQGASVEAW